MPRATSRIRRTVTTPLHQFLSRSLPAGTPVDGDARVSLRAHGRELPVTITAVAQRLFVVDKPAVDLAAGDRAVISISLDGGATRVDLPVEIAAGGIKRLVLRTAGAPLVLRRRVVRDLALAEALGVPPNAAGGATSGVMVAA
jgi:hypothetical protein